MTLFDITVTIAPLIAFWSIVFVAPRGRLRWACLFFGSLVPFCYALILGSQWIFDGIGCTGNFKEFYCPSETGLGYPLMAINFWSIMAMGALLWVSALAFLPTLIQAIRIRHRNR